MSGTGPQQLLAGSLEKMAADGIYHQSYPFSLDLNGNAVTTANA